MGLFSRKKAAGANPGMTIQAAIVPASGPANPIPVFIDPSGTSALVASEQAGTAKVSSVDLRKSHVSLAKKFDKAGVSLAKRDIAGIRAQAVLVLDYSGSMGGRYSSGEVQTLVERCLGFALQIDLDGEIPIIAFGSQVFDPILVDATNYQGVVDREIVRNPTMRMGTTNLTDALAVVRDMAGDPTLDAPLFVFVVTDGAPDNPSSCTDVVIDLSRFPAFLKFMAIDSYGKPYLDSLDDMDASRRMVDNVDAKFLPDVTGMSDLNFADASADEWDLWVPAARSKGVLL